MQLALYIPMRATRSEGRKKGMSRNLAALAAALVASGVIGSTASAEVDVNIGIGLPIPNVVIAEPPSVVAVPGTRVYYAPRAGVDLFFYSGAWYRKDRDRWYRASYYNGPWVFMSPRRVPVALGRLPRDYYAVPASYKPIPYGQLKKHWKKWEKEEQRHSPNHHHGGGD